VGPARGSWGEGSPRPQALHHLPPLPSLLLPGPADERGSERDVHQHVPGVLQVSVAWGQRALWGWSRVGQGHLSYC
jgi:hypothetical protein